MQVCHFAQRASPTGPHVRAPLLKAEAPHGGTQDFPLLAASGSTMWSTSLLQLTPVFYNVQLRSPACTRAIVANVLLYDSLITTLTQVQNKIYSYIRPL